jgi:RNA recognition motif-containing protein
MNVISRTIVADRYQSCNQQSNIFVGNLHPSVSEGDLIKMFQEYGEVKNISYMWHKIGPQRGQPKGYSFIEMETSDSAEKAIRGIHGRMFKGRKLVAKPGHSRQLSESFNPNSPSTSTSPLQLPPQADTSAHLNLKRKSESTAEILHIKRKFPEILMTKYVEYRKDYSSLIPK